MLRRTMVVIIESIMKVLYFSLVVGVELYMKKPTPNAWFSLKKFSEWRAQQASKVGNYSIMSIFLLNRVHICLVQTIQ